MDVCYIDESGSCELLDPAKPASTPVFVVAGVIVPGEALKNLAFDFLRLKQSFNPSLNNAKLSGLINHELKGSSLRADIRSGKHRRRRRAFGILQKTLGLLTKHDCRIVARVVVKDPNQVLDDRAIYGSAIGWLCRTFHRYLEDVDGEGIVVLDSRTKVKNTPNTDGITTQKFKSGGDPLERILEVPVFGHSDSHINLQLADLVASAMIFPAACSAYCLEHAWNSHACHDYDEVRTRLAAKVKSLQYRYVHGAGSWRGGVYVTGSGGYFGPDLLHPPAKSPQLPGIAAAKT